MNSKPDKVYGIIAELDSAASLFHAAEKIRDKGFKRWDVHTPFPVHGMDAAMGMKKSPIGYLVFLGGLAGALTGLALTSYPSIIEYPLIVHGKPLNLFTIPAFFPIIFELTILLSAFTAIGSLLVFSGLPRWHHPVFNWDRFAKVTDDAFFVVIEARDPHFSEKLTPRFLEELGATNITLLHENQEVSA